MQIPEPLQRAVDEAVSRSLRTELDARGLLLTRPDAAAAGAATVRSGTRLLGRTLLHCYPGSGFGRSGRAGRPVAEIEFTDRGTASRIATALAFGATTARLLSSPGTTRPVAPTEPVELLCAVFNLGIGLVDGLCDGEPTLGSGLLTVLGSVDLPGATQARQSAGWLRAALPAPLAADPTMSFTVRVIEVFFELLHSVHPDSGGAPLRDHVATLLVGALEAERWSFDRSVDHTVLDREHLIDCSRRTSVMPFQIIEQLTPGGSAVAAPTSGTLLGEAMWRIDDLVDLVQDAALDSLNAVLLAAMPQPAGSSGTSDPVAAVERVLNSGAVELTAAEAARCLDSGLEAAGPATAGRDAVQERRRFLSFVQTYAGVDGQLPRR